MFQYLISFILLAVQLANAAAIQPRQEGETVVTVTQEITVPALPAIPTPTKTSTYTVYKVVTAPNTYIQSASNVSTSASSISTSMYTFTGLHYSASSVSSASESPPSSNYTRKPSSRSSAPKYCNASKTSLAYSTASGSAKLPLSTGSSVSESTPTSDTPQPNYFSVISSMVHSHQTVATSEISSNNQASASSGFSSIVPTVSKPIPAPSSLHSTLKVSTVAASASSHSTAIVVVPITGAALQSIESQLSAKASASAAAAHNAIHNRLRGVRPHDHREDTNDFFTLLYPTPSNPSVVDLQPVTTITSTKPAYTFFSCGEAIYTSPATVVTYVSTLIAPTVHFSLDPSIYSSSLQQPSSTPMPAPPPSSTPAPPPSTTPAPPAPPAPSPPPSQSSSTHKADIHDLPKTYTVHVKEKRYVTTSIPSPSRENFSKVTSHSTELANLKARDAKATPIPAIEKRGADASLNIPHVTRFAVVSPASHVLYTPTPSVHFSLSPSSKKSDTPASSVQPATSSSVNISAKPIASSSEKPSTKPFSSVTSGHKPINASSPTPASTRKPWCPYPGRKCELLSQSLEPMPTTSKKWCLYPGQNC